MAHKKVFVPRNHLTGGVTAHLPPFNSRGAPMGACQHHRVPFFAARGALCTLPNGPIQGVWEHFVGTAYRTGALALGDRFTYCSWGGNYTGTQEMLRSVTCGRLWRALLARASSGDTGAWGITWKHTGGGDAVGGASQGDQAEGRASTSTVSGICTEGRRKGGTLKHRHHTK